MTARAAGGSPQARVAVRSPLRLSGPAGPVRFAFVAILVAWLAMPFLLAGQLAQDAVPFVVAGELAHDHPDDVYAAVGGDLYALRPAFAERSCAISPPGTRCTDQNVAFVASPLSLPLSAAAAALGPDVGILAFRLVGAIALVVGMGALWNRLASRSARAPAVLVATAAALTPMAVATLALGQTSPLLFAAAAVGVARTDGRPLRTALTAALWVLTVATKVVTAALALLLVVQRRWRLLAWAAGIGVLLVAATAALVPVDLAGTFVRASRELGAAAPANPFNGSVAAALHVLAPGLDGTAAGTGLAAVLVVAALAAGCWWGLRGADDDTQWAYGALLALLLAPFVWWHYLWVGVAAVAVVLAGRPSVDRELVALPVAAVATVPLAVAPGSVTWWPVVQVLLLAGFAVAVPVLRRLPAVIRNENVL